MNTITEQLNALFEDDHELLRRGIVMYGDLYAWLKQTRGETYTWKPHA